MDLTALAATIRRRGAAETLNALGEAVTILLTSEQTGGAFSLFEEVSQPGCGSPPHVHSRENESFYILEGEVRFHLGGQNIVAHPGDTLVAPLGVPHNFTNTGATPSRMLIMAHPAGFENFFREAAQLPPDATPQQVIAVLKAHGMDALPPFDQA